jgi:hypothetical protein
MKLLNFLLEQVRPDRSLYFSDLLGKKGVNDVDFPRHHLSEIH